MLSVKEKIELEELELMNSKIEDDINKEIEEEYEYDNRFGATLLLISYCAIALFIVYKVAELLVKRFS